MMAEEQQQRMELADSRGGRDESSAASAHSALEFAARSFFGLLLAAAAVAANIAGGWIFAALVAAASVSAVREWHRMIEPSRFRLELVVTAAAIVAAIGVAAAMPYQGWSWLLLFAGALASALLAGWRKTRQFWQAFGALYIGVAAVSLVTIRSGVTRGEWIVFGLFIVIWAADSGALLAGRLIGGPKLVPLLSPNKTWAGFIGGVLLAALGEAIYIAVFDGNYWLGGLFGVCLGLVASGGDLFESWVKRIFRRKNSGSLIPGHGGVLDRIDSTLFVAPVGAILLLVGIDTLFGAHP